MPTQVRPVAMRFDQIDVIRGLGMAAVVLLHTRQRFAQAIVGHADLAVPRWPYIVPRSFSSNGLTIFFAVSGFLITLISIRRFGSLDRLQPGAFYRMRFARIAPFMLLLLVVLSVLHLLRVPNFVINPHQASLSRAVFSVLTFTINWLESTRGTLPLPWEVLWSLSVEEVFYLFFPLVCLITCRWMRQRWALVSVLLIFVMIGPFARAFSDPNGSWRHKGYLNCMDCIALGCLTALLAEHIRTRGNVNKILLVSLQIFGSVVAIFISLGPNWISFHSLERLGLDTSILALSICLITFSCALRNKPGTVWMEPVRFLGRYTYEAYLTHAFIVILLVHFYVKWRFGPITFWYIAILVISAGVACLFATYYSEPLNRRLRKPVERPLPVTS